MAETRRVRVAAVGDVAAGEARVVEAAGKTLALFNVGGTYYAIDNACAHRGGPLGEGELDGRRCASLRQLLIRRTLRS